MDISGAALTSKAVLVDPKWEDWEAVRWLITKLWYQQDKSINNVISLLQEKYKLKVSYVMP